MPTSRVTALADEDFRLSVPLFTVGEAARYLDIPASSLSRWSRTDLLVTREVGRGRQASIPFMGLAEGIVLKAFRATRIPMQRIIPALEKIKSEIGLEHALASRRLYSDGAEILFDYGESSDPLLSGLTVVRSGQVVFTDVIRQYLKALSRDAEGWPKMVRVPRFDTVDVVVDPRRSFGQPILADYGVRVEDLVDRARGREPHQRIARDFDVPLEIVEDVLRAA